MQQFQNKENAIEAAIEKELTELHRKIEKLNIINSSYQKKLQECVNEISELKNINE